MTLPITSGVVQGRCLSLFYLYYILIACLIQFIFLRLYKIVCRCCEATYKQDFAARRKECCSAGAPRYVSYEPCAMLILNCCSFDFITLLPTHAQHSVYQQKLCNQGHSFNWIACLRFVNCHSILCLCLKFAVKCWLIKQHIFLAMFIVCCLSDE